jgi:chromosomal replication initiation ATPase DnaA
MFRPGFYEIVEKVGGEFKVSKDSILISQRGRTQNNLPRWVAMYIAQQCGGMKLKDIAISFGLKKTGSISTSIKKLERLLKGDVNLLRNVNRINVNMILDPLWCPDICFISS